MTYINNFYSDVVDAVVSREPFKYYRRMYHIATTDHSEKNYWTWIDKLLDDYNKYRSNGFDDFESQVNSLMDGLEGVIRG